MILSRRHFRGDFYIEERSGAFTANERGPEPV